MKSTLDGKLKYLTTIDGRYIHIYIYAIQATGHNFRCDLLWLVNLRYLQQCVYVSKVQKICPAENLYYNKFTSIYITSLECNLRQSSHYMIYNMGSKKVNAHLTVNREKKLWRKIIRDYITLTFSCQHCFYFFFHIFFFSQWKKIYLFRIYLLIRFKYQITNFEFKVF